MIRTMMVGLGQWGKVLSDSIQNKSQKIKISYALTQTASDDARNYCKNNNIKLLTCSFDDAVKNIPEIDAVILATPHSQHFEQVKIASKHRKHIACEKPFTLNRSDAIAAIKEAEKNNIVLSVLYNRRFNPVVKKIKKLIKDDSLGTIINVECNFSGDAALRETRKVDTWRSNPAESPLGSMTSRGLHLIDTLVSFFGEINKVYTISENRILNNLDDTTSCLVWFEKGMKGYISTSNVTAPFWWIKVYGSEATAEMRDYNTLVMHKRGKDQETMTFNKIDIEKAELESFADNIKSGLQFPIPKNEIINVSTFLEASCLSKNLNKPIDLASYE